MRTTVAAQRNIFRELVRRFADQHEDNTDFREILVDARIALAKFTDDKEAVDEDTSDGYNTFRELYRYRMLYNAAFFNMLSRHTGIPVVKSRRHGDGELCFGGGWFIVMAQLPTGQVSNHYEDRYWGLFDVPDVEMAPEWDGHTPNDAADRLESFLEMREPDGDRSNPSGNAAAMRETLEEQLRYWNAHVRTREEEEMRKRTEAALAAPARNCDKYSLDDIKKMDRDFGAFCKQFGAKNGENCSGCPIKPMDNLCCHSTWMLLPAAEGGAKCIDGLRGDPDCRGCEEHCEDVRRRNCINWSGDHCARTKGIFCPVSCDEFRAYKPAEGGDHA